MKIIKSCLVSLICFICLTTTIESQNRAIDSLENALIIHKEKDTTRVNNLDHLSFLYYRKDIDKAKEYIERADELAKELNYAKGIGNATYMRAVVEMVQSNFDLSIEYFEEAAKIYEENNLIKSMTGCYNGLGIIYSHLSDYEQSTMYYEKALQLEEEVGVKRNIPNYIINIGSNQMKTGQYAEALTSFEKSLELYTDLNHTLGIANSLKNMALIYKTQGNYPLSLEYNNKALVLAEKIQDSTGISNSLNNISILYKIQGHYDKSLELLEKSLTIQERLKNRSRVAGIKTNIGSIYIEKEDNTTAIKYLNEALEINREISDKSQQAESLNNLGYIYVTLKKYEDAYNYYNEAKNINIEIDNQEGISLSNLGIADCYMEQKKYDKALPHILRSFEISKKLDLLDHQKDAYKFLSIIYENNGDYKNAYKNHKQFKIINDSLFNTENTEKFTQLEYEHKYKQALDSASIRELKLTKTVQATSQDLQKSQRNYLWAIIGVLLVSILLGAIIFYQKLRHVKAKTQNIIMEQKLLRSQMTPHFIFNSLSVLQGMILNKEEKKSVHYLSKFSKLLRITLENSRDKTVSLSQELAAVQDYLTLQNLENEAYKCTILVEDSIDVELFEVPPMLIQPFVENAIEHAFVNQSDDRKIDIRLTYLDKKLVCTITDNGIGINYKCEHKNNGKKSLATTITSERLKVLSKDFKMEGSVTIEDRQKFNETGTRVTLVIPHKLVLG
ncbi:tetratricopeptide repeat-containing sensor histidine kinase [Psychroserpens mesophilus]|uniref:tetratricopeptide repeat-containing sensor histidine kinase n=1 Tax=Psychroserpens mesophilus TaxID=325473 RepID=UPI00058B5BAB|nr:tetratricopeptide repeat protein [Psychroserpens mesophilus]